MRKNKCPWDLEDWIQLKRAQKLGCAEMRCELDMRKQYVHYRVFFWVHMAEEGR